MSFSRTGRYQRAYSLGQSQTPAFDTVPEISVDNVHSNASDNGKSNPYRSSCKIVCITEDASEDSALQMKAFVSPDESINPTSLTQRLRARTSIETPTSFLMPSPAEHARRSFISMNRSPDVLHAAMPQSLSMVTHSPRNRGATVLEMHFFNSSMSTTGLYTVNSDASLRALERYQYRLDQKKQHRRALDLFGPVLIHRADLTRRTMGLRARPL